MRNLFSFADKITDKTDTIDIETNNDFLNEVFSNKLEEDLPVIVSFDGNPNDVRKSSWSGKAWDPRAFTFKDQNAYFSLASFKQDESGDYKRQKKYFSALHAIMLDDIGVKVLPERITLAPSWILETSPGNYQTGYIFKEPLQDVKVADKLMKAIIAAELCDPGAGGPTARLARMPLGINGKLDPVFKCKLELWNPETRYTVDELVNGFELDIHNEAQKKKAKRKKANAKYADEIFVPRPEENPVILALISAGLYKKPLSDNKHDITCPWVHEHTDGVDNGTAYFEPSETYPLGGFSCMHGHCSDRRIGALLEHFELEYRSASMKSAIRCAAGELHQIIDKGEQELAQLGKYYQRGGLIVTITTDPGTRQTCVKDVKQNALVAALSNAAEWEKYSSNSDAWYRIAPPTRVVSGVYDATNYNHLAVLNGLAHQPFLRKDGSIAFDSGYDRATGMYGVFKDNAFKIASAPTKEAAQAALKLIQSLLSEFAFADEIDHAAALSAILAAVVRPSLPLAPMYHVRAPQISSGKSFLCQIIGLFASPRLNTPTSFPQDDEECRKLLLAELLRAPPVIEFDNMTTDIIAHKSLCTSLTSEFLTGRILGVSKTATVNTRTLFLSSGNNVGPINDMTRRCLTIHLDPACERPATRTFKNPHLLQDLTKDRELYVSAALTIIRAWICAERPKTECKPLASYGEWTELCRQPLMWLGQPDPATKIFKTMDDDPDREILGRLLTVWRYHFGSVPKMVRDAVNKANLDYNSEIYEVLNDIAGDRHGINRKILGHWVKRHARQIVGGMRFIPGTGSRSAAAWRVEVVDEKKSV